MITLTTPHDINSILGGNAPVPYNKLVISPFTMDPVGQSLAGTLRLTSTTTPSMQPITGTLRVGATAAELIIEVPQLDFYRRLDLTGPQRTAILNQIEAAQAQLENGLVLLGVIAGIRSTGT